MSDNKSPQEQIAAIEEKMKQLRVKKQRIVARESQKERKARTKRLIEVGAIFEKYFEIEGKEKAEVIAKNISDTVKKTKGKWFADAHAAKNDYTVKTGKADSRNLICEKGKKPNEKR